MGVVTSGKIVNIRICDMIKGNESDRNIDFELQA